MNRAWIPAGALASVSVAGLIALGPLTDSLGTSVAFPTTVHVATNAENPGNSSVPVSVTLPEAVGITKTAKLDRGGRAARVIQAPTAGDAGYVGYHRNATPATPRVTVAVEPKKPAVKPAKKAPKRQQSIGTTGEPNSDNGLAGGSGQGAQGQGETSSTLAP